MTEYCPVCCLEEPVENFVRLSCGCTFCSKTINQWVTVQLESYYSADFKIMCPQALKSHILSEEDLRLSLSSSNYAHYESLMLRRFLLKDSSYKFCPRCNSVGWVPKGLRCRGMLQCRDCETDWLDPSLKPWSDKLADFMSSVSSEKSEFWSYTWKEIWSKRCPKCQSPIEKNGGCYHMTCQHCSYEFCWDCLQSYKNHNSEFCALIVAYRYLLFILLALMMLVKISYYNDLVYSLGCYLLEKLIYSAFITALAFLAFFTTHSIYSCFGVRYRPVNRVDYFFIAVLLLVDAALCVGMLYYSWVLVAMFSLLTHLGIPALLTFAGFSLLDKY